MNKLEFRNELIKRVDKDPLYNFLKREPLKDNIVLLGLGGSYAYGTNNENSDLDLRGVAVHSPRDILTGQGFDQVVNTETDTTVYSLRKIVHLLSNCNPNTIEILGLEPWQYLKVSEIGEMLINNASLFLSKRAVRSFGGYVNAQLWRLKNKAIRTADQSSQEQHILNSIESARYSFREKYFYYPDDAINLYVDKALDEDHDSEIFMDVNLKHYPLRDYKDMWAEMHNIVKSYNKLGMRNSKAIEHGKLGKHMMHLVRLYLMAFDILEDGKIVTYRTKEHDFLMDIRNGKYLDDNDQPTKEFYDIVETFESKLDDLSRTSPLPAFPDYEKIDDLVVSINERILSKDKRGEYEKGQTAT